MARRRRTVSAAPAGSQRPVEQVVGELLEGKEMVLVCGSGGTGKTTIAAALGARVAAGMPKRVLVLTVDPARRLATALGVGSGEIGNAAVQVPPPAFQAADVEPRGELWVAMLDTKAGWDDLVRRHAPDADVRERVLANPLYRNITSRFVHSHDYIAMERLHELHAFGDYDLVIIDTPPSRNALDLLDAPSRMREFFSSRLLRWLTVPYRSRVFTIASKPFYQVADRILGSRFLQDIAEFFVLFQAMEGGFVARATEVERLLVDRRTTFLVVTTLETAPAHEATFLATALRERRMSLGALILNRTLPTNICDPAAPAAARRMQNLTADELAALPQVAAGDLPGAAVARVLRQAGDRFLDTLAIAEREAQRRIELARLAPVTLAAPTLQGDVTDLDGLLELTARLA